MFCGDLNGKEIQKRGNICTRLLIHFIVPEKLRQLCEATILQEKWEKNAGSSVFLRTTTGLAGPRGLASNPFKIKKVIITTVYRNQPLT